MAKQLSRTVSIYVNGKQVDATLKQLRAEVRRLENEQAKLPIGTQAYINKSLELARLNGVLREQRAAVNNLNNSWDEAAVKLNTVANAITGLYSLFQMGDMAIGSLKDLAKDAAALDDVYADVMKTTGLTHQEVEDLNEAFKQMDTRTAREQLNQLAYEAGKLGIASKEQVAQFVAASDKINIALGDVLGEGAMVTIGKLADVYAKSTQQLVDAGDNLEKKMLAIGSAVNQLGQSSTANEGYLVEFMSRMGGIATQAGLSADAILGFASALDQDMMKQEMSATAFQKFIMQMISKPAEFARAAEMDVREFSELMEKDMNEALLRVLESFSGEGGLMELQPIFKDLGLDAARAASVISSMANSVDEIRTAQRLANEELTTGDSIIREFTTKNTTMAAEAEKAKKKFEDIRLELGEKLYPVFIHFTKSGTAALKGLAGYVDLWKENKVAAVALTTALAGLSASLFRAQLMKAKDKVVTLAKTAAMKLEERQTLRQAAAEAKHTAQIERERVAILQRRIEQEKGIIARMREGSAVQSQTALHAAQNRLRTLEIALTEQQTVATNAATAATKAQSAAIKATPWGALIAALAAAAVGITKLVRHQQRFNREARETSKQFGEESAKAQYLFDKLEKLNEKSDEYNSTLSQLNELYPDLLAKYTDEEGKLRDIAAARQAVIDGIRQQILEQRRMEKLADIEGDYQDKYMQYVQHLRKALVKELGEAAGQSAYQDILAALPQSFDESIDTYQKAVEGVVGKNAKYIAEYRTIVAGIRNAQKRAEEERKKWEDLYAEHGYSQTLTDSDFDTVKKSRPTRKTSTTNIIPSPEEAADNLKKWNSVKEQANKLITDFSVNTRQGLDKLFAEIEAKSASMRKNIEEATGASRAEKDALIKQVEAAANAYRSAKIDEYLKKYNEEVAKLNSSDSGNEQLDKVREAAARLQQQLAATDEQIRILSQDLEQQLSEEQRENLERLIAQYERMKETFARRAFKGIDTSVDTSGFAITGDRAKDATEYARLTSQIKRAREAAVEMRDTVTDPTIRAEYEAQITELDEQQEAINRVYQGVDKLAKRIEQSTALEKLIDNLDYFGNQALDILEGIFDIMDNIGQRELNDAAKLRDENTTKLDEMLEQNLITEEEYTKKKQQLDDDYEEKQKEIELAQWRREKALNASEATMAAALAILRVWSDAGNGTTAMRIAKTAIVGAATLAQLTAILSEPAPYAKGGYVPHAQVYKAGEAGSEWVAPHRMLQDPATAPIIAALEQYRRGGTVAPDALNMPAIGMAASQRKAQQAADYALLAEMRKLSAYLSDPRNRQAVISRQTQETFESNENFLRTVSRL